MLLRQDGWTCISSPSYFQSLGNTVVFAWAGLYPAILSIFWRALSGPFSFPPSPPHPAPSPSFSAPFFGSLATPPPPHPHPHPRITKPALPARPIELQTAQVMINTNTQQWEQHQPGSSLGRHTLSCGRFLVTTNLYGEGFCMCRPDFIVMNLC